METSFLHYPRCTCSAAFPTRNALDAHLEENKSLEEYFIARAEICRGHAKANGGDGSETDSADDSGVQCYEPNLHPCPFKGCERMIKPFASRQRLRRHYEQHVKCREICVCCHRNLQCVRDFIRHAERHQDASRTKLCYINNMCEELRSRASEELENREESRRSREAEMARKRTHKMAELDLETAGFERKRDKVEQTRHSLQLPSTDEEDAFTGPITLSNQLAQPLPTVAMGIDGGVDTLGSIPANITIADSVQATAGIFDDLDFDAPVNGIVNFPDCLDLWPG